jgi:hypothetical protein
MKKGGSFAETAYDASATFGRVVAFFQMLAGIIFGIILCLVGVLILRSKPDPQQPDQGGSKWAAAIFILIGIFMFFGSIVWFILTLRYKAVAAGTGAVTAVGLTANAVFD